MKNQTYYIPVTVERSVEKKRAADPRTGKERPPIGAAYVQLLKIAMKRLQDWDFDCAVMTNLIEVDTNDGDNWQKVNIPVPEKLHAQVKAAAAYNERGLYNFAHCLFLEAEKEFEYSQIKSEKIQCGTTESTKAALSESR
jgi:hypothetical protein